MDSPNLPRPQPPVTLPPPLVAIPGLLRSPSGSGSSTPTGGAPLPVALPPPIAHLPPGALPLPSVLPPVMPLPSLGSLGHGLPRPVAPISARDGAPTTPHTPTSPAPAPAPLPAPTPVPVPTPAAPPAEAHVAPASTSVHAPPSHSAAPGSAPTPPPPAAPLPPHHDAPHQQPPMPAPLPTPTQTLAPPVAAVAPTAVHAPVAAAAAAPATPPTQDGAPPPLPDRSRGNTVVWGAHAAAAAAAAAAPAPAPGSAAAAALASVISPRDTLAPAPPRRDSSMTHMRKASYDSPRRGSAGASPSNIEAARAASASVGDHDSSDDEDDGTAGAVSSSGGGSFQMPTKVVEAFVKLEELHADTEPSAADDQILALLRDALEQVIDSARPAITNSRAQDTSELDEVIPALDKYRSFFAKATALLGEIVEYNGPRPEAGKSESTNALLKQFVESEGEYVRKLLMVAKHYHAPIASQNLLPKADEQTIFSKVDELLDLHASLFSAVESLSKSGADLFGETILPKIEAMNIYIQYSMNTTEARQCLERSIKEHKPLASFLKSIEKTGFDPLDSLLQLPLTKLDHYMMFVERYLKAMAPSSKDRPLVEDAFYKLADLVEECGAKESVQDNLLRVMEVGDAVEGLEENLVRPDRRFIYEAPLKIVTGATKPIADYVFLFNDLMLYAFVKSISQRKFVYVGQFGMHTVSIKPEGTAPNSFALVVTNGSAKTEYQLQANDAATKDAALVQFGKVIRDVERYRKVFGVPLKVLLKREKESDIPTIVEKSIKFIYDYGIKTEGVFRLSGRATQIEKLRDQLDQGKKVFFSEDMDVHSVASLFKQWLRELPEPLLTWGLYDDFMATAAEPDEATKIARLKDLICNQLPRPNRFAFQHMVRCLYEITQNEQYTKLNATTLSVVFAPNVLKNGDPNANPFDTKCYEVINAIFKEFLSHYDEIFHEVEMERQAGEVKLRKKGPLNDAKKTARRASARVSSEPGLGDGAVYEGTLLVQEKKKWVQRFCVAKPKELHVYKSAREKKAKNKLVLVDYTVASALSTGKPFSFAISYPKKKGESTFFAASSAEEQEEWIQVLKTLM